MSHAASATHIDVGSLLTIIYMRFGCYTANAVNRAVRRDWHGDSLFEPPGEVGMAIAFSSRQARLAWRFANAYL